MKKTVSIFLILMLLLNSFPFIANAQSFTLTYEFDAESNTAIVTGCEGDASEIIIPESVHKDGQDYTVTEIGEFAFCNMPDITFVSMADTVTKIGENAFFLCAGLENVEVSQSVKEIGEYCFAWCVSLKEINIPQSVVKIDTSAFYDCTSLEKVEISDIANWLDIEFGPSGANPLDCAKNLYVNSSLVENLVIPEGVTQIKPYAFSGADCIKSVSLPSTLVTIGERAFENCNGLLGVALPGSVTSLGEYAFQGCEALEYAIIGTGVKTIPTCTFKLCMALKNVAFTGSITSISSYAFADASNLENVWFTESCANIGIDVGNTLFTGAKWQYNADVQENHVYANKCSENCAICGDIRAISHFYDFDCDDTCNECGFVRNTDHNWQDGFDSEYHFSQCTICKDYAYKTKHDFALECDPNCLGCDYVSDAECVYEKKYDEQYHFEQCKYCQDVINLAPHQFESACNEVCDCGFTGNIGHDYQEFYNDDIHYTECTVCHDVSFSEPHRFESVCDKTCSECEYTRETEHDYKKTYDKDTHFEKCSKCQDEINVELHIFENDCDTSCSECDYTRQIEHKYVQQITETEHYDECYICFDVVNRAEHKFDNDCDTTCADCQFERQITHTYTNDCDTTCNVCQSTRKITHKYGEYTYNYDATSDKDGTKTRVCSVCEKEETVTAKGTKLINSSKTFKDVPANAWYKKFVDFAVTNGIFKGTSDKTFSPEQNMTRAQFVMVFANLSGIDTSNNNVKSGFKDVPKGKWYTAAVTWAAKNNIVSGVGDGKFDPEAKVTREQMCVMLVNYIEKYQKKELKVTTNAPKFADDKNISSWAKTAVYKCAKAGLVNGVGNNKFDPSASATRAQGATIFTSFYKEYMV